MAVKSLWHTEKGINVSDSIGATPTPTKNLSYVQTFTDFIDVNDGDARVIKLFDPIIIQANKKVEIHLSTPLRNPSSVFGGFYLGMNIKVNDTWYNMGNSGYDGTMSTARIAASYTKTKIFDFISVLNLPDDEPYTIQIELIGRSYRYTVNVNGAHDINTDAKDLWQRGDPVADFADQNYTNVLIKEMDR